MGCRAFLVFRLWFRVWVWGLAVLQMQNLARGPQELSTRNGRPSCVTAGGPVSREGRVSLGFRFLQGELHQKEGMTMLIKIGIVSVCSFSWLFLWRLEGDAGVITVAVPVIPVMTLTVIAVVLCNV